ncbi:hypothetical protein BURC_01008 [Burkholderiaceae bacterium]|nr:hypothetical protein BURC_01008 [Burkholderiaceae bacterium]
MAFRHESTKKDGGEGVNVRLCDVIEGVEFTVVEQDEAIRVLILRDALENWFGAGDTPDSWLAAYRRYADTIDFAAADRHRLDRTQGVIVLRGDRPEEFTSSPRQRAKQLASPA